MSEKSVASIKTLARYEPEAVYIGTGEYIAECVRVDDGDYYLAADVDAAIEALQAENEALRAEVERANSWNERVSVCRDHVVDIVDGICVICTLDAVEAHAGRLQEEVDRLAQEMVRIQQQYDERTACMIIHRGSALACSDAVRAAYYEEHERAEQLAEALREYGLPLTGDNKRDAWEFGDEAVAREKRRRAALEQEEGRG